MNDLRLHSPAFHRNVAPITAAFAPWLDGRSGDVLELGSGSGQHVLAFAKTWPALRWWPTDPEAPQRASIDAWRAVEGTANVETPFALDAAADEWSLDAPGRPRSDDLIAMVCLNVVHISPWSVTEGLFAGAGRYLAGGGLLLLYGPYNRDGRHTAPSNARFDADLRARNPSWGIRDLGAVEQVARVHKLELAHIEAMPANNFTLVFRKAP